MKELAINTADKRGQLLLTENKKIIDEVLWEGQSSHSEVITSEFENLLNKHNIESAEIKNLYCVVGPGSFTGLRVGVSFAKTLAYVNAVPIFPVNSLDLLAMNCTKSDHPIVSLIDAQKNSVFCSTYSWKQDKRVSIISNKVVPIKELHTLINGSIYYCGHGLDKYKNVLDQELLKKLKSQPEWLKMDLKKLFGKDNFCLNKGSLTWNQVQPLYIKASAPEEKLKQNS